MTEVPHRGGGALRLAAASVRRLPPVRGRGRVAHVVHRRLGRQAGGSFSIPMRRGHRMVVPMASAQSWEAAFTACYDDAELDLLLGHVAEGSLVVDVGASLGFYTVPLAQAARRRDAHVVAFEPVAANVEVLVGNLAGNGLEPIVSVLGVGLGRVAEEAVVHVETGGAGNATVVSGLDPAETGRHDRAGGTGSTATVRICRLDDVELPPAAGSRRCSLMKIDVEGFEAEVLAGAARFVTEHRPTIFAEFNPAWLATRGEPPGAPQAWARANGYVCHELVYKRPNPLLDRRRITLRPLPAGAARSGTSLLLTPR